MMRTFTLKLVAAGALAIGAWFSAAEAARLSRHADAHQSIVTLQHDGVDRGLDAALTATVAYWLGDYANVTFGPGSTPAADTSAAADAHVLRVVANAAFRQSQREPGAGQAAVQRLDGVLQAYASALKASSRDIDAAYNYEYVARLRDRVARAPQGKPAKPQPAAPVTLTAGDLPAGPTIHGRPGAPPPDAKMEELEMLAPLEYGDREAQPDATPGAKRERKGD
jgi:hypothetical protein